MSEKTFCKLLMLYQNRNNKNSNKITNQTLNEKANCLVLFHYFVFTFLYDMVKQLKLK